jgi:hypothetical protein
MQRLTLFGMSALLGAALAGCGGHDHAGGSTMTPPPASNMVMFDSYAQMLVTASTCENDDAVDTNGKSFTFAAGEDSTDAAGTDGITPACQAQ